MPYPQRLLNDHEAVVVDLHPHWWYFVRPTALLVVAIGAGIVTIAITDTGTTVRTVAAWASLAAIVLCTVWVIVRYLRWGSTHFVVTDQRIIFRTGVVARRGVEIPLDRVNTVHSSQGLGERIVGAGDIAIESGGEFGQQHFTDIRHPGRVQREIHAQMAARAPRSAGAGPGGAFVDVAGQLEKLEGMLARGTITREEFDLQKRRLLGP